MDREEMIQKEVQAALEQFERAKRLTPRAFFYTRVRARLEERERARGWTLMSGVLKPGLLALLVACNIATAAVLLKEGDTEAIDRSTVVNTIGEELGLGRSDTDLFLTE